MWLSQSKTGKFFFRPLALYAMSTSLHAAEKDAYASLRSIASLQRQTV
jgi:hypothetical protein